MQSPATPNDASLLDAAIDRLLARGGLIDLTTTGRRTGRPRRIEVVFHNVDGRLIVTGRPDPGRTRAWVRNVAADPLVVVHLKGTLQADLPGTARVVDDPTERRAIADWVVRHAWPSMDVDAMVAASPMIQIELHARD